MGNELKLVFITSLQSESIVEMFKKAGVSNIISINSNSIQNDESSSTFQSKFYQFLISGKSIEKSYKYAIKAVKDANIDLNICCCSHPHNDDCEWYEKKFKHNTD